MKAKLILLSLVYIAVVFIQASSIAKRKSREISDDDSQTALEKPNSNQRPINKNTKRQFVFFPGDGGHGHHHFHEGFYGGHHFHHGGGYQGEYDSGIHAGYHEVHGYGDEDYHGGDEMVEDSEEPREYEHVHHQYKHIHHISEYIILVSIFVILVIISVWAYAPY